jgi:hypothetical protein
MGEFLCSLEWYFTCKAAMVANEKKFDRKLAYWIDANGEERNGFDVNSMNSSVY